MTDTALLLRSKVSARQLKALQKGKTITYTDRDCPFNYAEIEQLTKAGLCSGADHQGGWLLQIKLQSP